MKKCEKCGAHIDGPYYFTGLHTLCEECAEEFAREDVAHDTIDTILIRIHAMEERGMTRADIDTLYDLIQDVVGDEEQAVEDCMRDMLIEQEDPYEYRIA